MLAIPATSAADERVFSALAHLWSDKRANMLMGRAAMLAIQCCGLGYGWGGWCCGCTYGWGESDHFLMVEV